MIDVAALKAKVAGSRSGPGRPLRDSIQAEPGTLSVRRTSQSRREKYFSRRSLRTTAKEAAYAAIPEAYLKAGRGRYPVNARQIMYAARPAIQDATGQPLNDAYFTQTLLPDYIRDHPEETADWTSCMTPAVTSYSLIRKRA